jgi:S-adenosylmethionine decarboxylase
MSEQGRDLAKSEPPFFEGTEKRIELDFAGDGSLCDVPRKDWEEVVRLSSTQVLNEMRGEHQISYLLSESSLIVYPRKVILKTCGKTVPICSVGKVHELARQVGLEPEWLCYSRKDYLNPLEQPWEHQSQEREITLCRSACRGLGDAYVLGALTGEHWLIYDAQFKPTDGTKTADFQVDIMMYELPQPVRQAFFTNEPEGSAEGAAQMTRVSGLGALVDSIGGQIDDYSFSPCGYSCNVHAGEAYATVHVTPQESCSYASFETNLGSRRYSKPGEDCSKALNDLVTKVLDIFQPKRLTITLFVDQGAMASIGSAPFAGVGTRYTQRTKTSTRFEMDYVATIVNYVENDRKRPLEDGEEGSATPAKK